MPEYYTKSLPVVAQQQQTRAVLADDVRNYSPNSTKQGQGRQGRVEYVAADPEAKNLFSLTQHLLNSKVFEQQKHPLDRRSGSSGAQQQQSYVNTQL